MKTSLSYFALLLALGAFTLGTPLAAHAEEAFDSLAEEIAAEENAVEENAAQDDAPQKDTEQTNDQQESAAAPEDTQSAEEPVSDQSADQDNKSDAESAEKKEDQTEETPRTPTIAEALNLPKKTKSAVLDVDLANLESIGLLKTPAENSLGRDLWNDTRRSFLTEFIPLIPEPNPSPAHQRMVMGLLLSETSPQLVVKDEDITPGKDILTLRLEKLLELGAYLQAYKLYSQINAEPYHSNLAKAGILAMLFNGEKAVACLEYKTLDDRKFEDPFWDEMALYCNYLLSVKEGRDKAAELLSLSSLGTLRDIGANQKFKVNYSTERFKSLDVLERAIVMADERIVWPALSSKMLRELPLNHLGMILARKDLKKEERFTALRAAALRGLANASMLGEFYTAIFDSDLRQLENPQNLGWKQIPYAYQKAKTAHNDEEKWEYINSALPMIQEYGAHTFIPFGEFLQTLDAKGQSESTILRGLDIIKVSGSNFPGKWSRFYSQLDPKTKNQKKLVFISAMMTTQSASSLIENPAILQYLDSLGEEKRIIYSSVIENLDKNLKNIHNADGAYGKDTDLTLPERYAMPTPRVWNQLIESSQNKRIGEAVLLTSVMLRDIPLDEHYPGVIGDVLQSLNTVGLTNLSKSLALETVLDQQ